MFNYIKIIILAIVATQPGYVKPIYSEDNIIEVREGRNPITEVNKITYVPNDIILNVHCYTNYGNLYYS